MKRAIILRIFIVVAIIFILSVIIYNDYQQSVISNQPVAVNSTSTVVSITHKNSTPIITGVKIEDDSQNVKLVGPIPDLDRPYTVPSSFTLDADKNLISKISFLVSSLKSNPKLLSNWYDLAVYRKMVLDYKGAEEIWFFTARNWPSSYISFANLADLYTFYLKDYSKAEDNLKKVIAIDPNNIAAFRNLYSLYTNQYTEKKDLALPSLLLGVKDNPKSIDLLILAAYYYRDIGDKLNAKIYFEKALDAAKSINDISAEKDIANEMNNL